MAKNYANHYGGVSLQQAVYLTNVEGEEATKLFEIVRKFENENFWGPNLGPLLDTTE